jgi:hypothetical protein
MNMSKGLKAAIDAAAKLEELYHEMNTTRCTHCTNKYGPKVLHGVKTEDTIQRGCCGGCASHMGYLTDSPIYSKIVKLYWWDRVYGFFNPVELRCNIPRLLRSDTCLGYLCYPNEIPLSVREPLVETLYRFAKSPTGSKEILEYVATRG